uniref:Fanconi-associated nuclease n=1 Tax=Ditylenchus dipsaci TaxID=166011 RepID=A0A915EI40_9BILA
MYLPTNSTVMLVPKEEYVDEKLLSLQEIFDLAVSKIYALISEQGWDSRDAIFILSNDLPLSEKNIVVKSEPSATLHYTLEFFWNIVLQSLQAEFPTANTVQEHNGIQKIYGSRVISFFGSNLIPLHSLINCSVEAQVLFVRLFLRRRDWCSIKPSARLKSFPDVPNENWLSYSQNCNIMGSSNLLLHRKFLWMKLKESTMLRSIKKLVGDACFRIPESLWKFFLSLFTLYSPNTMDSSELIDGYVNLPQQLLFRILQVRRGEAKYPAPAREALSVMLDYYSSYDDLLSYVDAKLMEEKILNLEKKRDYDSLILFGEEAKKTLVTEHLDNEFKIRNYKSLPKCVRKFSGAWVLIRCVYHLIEALQTIKDFERAVRLLQFLINDEGVRMFCHSVRGVWYNRLTLNLDFHLKRKDEAVKFCLLGLSDEGVGSPMVLALQNRLKKLVAEKDFQCAIKLIEPKKITIEGVVLGKNLGDQRTNRFYIYNSNGQEDIGNCDVEIVALDYFLKNGYTEGLHAEELQTNPLDLNSGAFYSSRLEMFEDRFNEILIIIENHCATGWECFTDLDQIQRFLSCCTSDLLVNVFRRMAMDYRNTRRMLISRLWRWLRFLCKARDRSGCVSCLGEKAASTRMKHDNYRRFTLLGELTLVIGL